MTPCRNRYYLKTWGTYQDKFTPQKGVRTGPYTLWGLRKAICKLRGMCYGCKYVSKEGIYSYPSVLIYREEHRQTCPKPSRRKKAKHGM